MKSLKVFPVAFTYLVSFNINSKGILIAISVYFSKSISSKNILGRPALEVCCQTFDR